MKRDSNENSFGNTIKNFLSENVKLITGGIITLLIGLIGYYIIPLKEFLYHSIYKEKAEVEIRAENKRIHQGDILELNILVMPQSKIDISEGSCEIVYDKDIFRLTEGVQNFNFSEIKGPKYLFDDFSTKLVGLKPSTTYIKVKLQTRYNIFYDSIQINVLPPYKSETPTLSDFSGIWPFQLGHNGGEMNLKDNNGKLSGTYNLANGDSGVISGLRDGSIFKMDFIRTGEMVKWHIEANWNYRKPFIEIDGEGYEVIIRNNSWERIDQSQIDFFSSVKIE